MILRHHLVFVLLLASCAAPNAQPLATSLDSTSVQLCAEMPLWTLSTDKATYSDRPVAEMMKGLGYVVGRDLVSLSPDAARHLCALREGPLQPGDSVIRLLRMPLWEYQGRAYAIRLQVSGRRTELTSRALAVCRHDSLFAAAPREWVPETGDTIYHLGEVEVPGEVEFELIKPVSRKLFREVLSYLESTGFWESTGHIPNLDAYSNYVEVQLGDRYKALHYPYFSYRQPPIEKLIDEAELNGLGCPTANGPSLVREEWLIDEPKMSSLRKDAP